MYVALLIGRIDDGQFCFLHQCNDVFASHDNMEVEVLIASLWCQCANADRVSICSLIFG